MDFQSYNSRRCSEAGSVVPTIRHYTNGMTYCILPCIPPIKEHRKEHNVLYINYGHVHVYVCISITKMIQLKLKCFTTKQSNNAYFHFRL